MSKITFAPNASGTGTLTVAAPNTNSDYTLTLPAETGTVLTSGGAIDVNASAPADSITISSTGQTKVSSSSNPALLVNRTSSTGDPAISFQSTGTEVARITGIYGDGMIFHTGTSSTERVRIPSSGGLLIGTTSTTVNASNFGTYIATTLAHSRNTPDGGVAQFYGSSGENRLLGNGSMQNTLNSYGGISDIKLKENIVDATPKLDKLLQVRVVNYNLKELPDQKLLGVIAQEIETIFPGIVSNTPDEDADGNDLGTTTKSVKYSVFVPMLIKAVQEQQAIIESLTARVEALEAANVNP